MSEIELLKGLNLIEGYRLLENNWNGYDAPKIDESIISKAKEIIRNISLVPDIFPTGRNSIQFEFEKKNGDYLEFEIYKNKISCLCIMNKKSETFNLNPDQIEQTINNFHGIIS